MTGTFIGLNLKYLPWQLFVPVMFVMSIVCIYFGVTVRGRTKALNAVCFCAAIGAILMGMENLAIHTGIFAQYLSIIEILNWFFFAILLIILFCF